MAVKKPASAKKKTTAANSKKGPASKKTTAKNKGPASKKNVKEVKKPAAKKGGKKTETRGGANREVNPETGFVVGTDQDAIATALLEGGESRAAIVEQLENTLEPTTRNGTEKKITNMVSGVLNKMLAQGYTIESSFVLNPPTPASKRAATRAANAAKPAAKKTPAKKSSAKKGAAAKKGKKK